MSRYQSVLHIPDIHVPFEDKAAVDAAMWIAGKCQPDTVVVHGDLMDCYTVSRFSKDPTRGVHIQEEADMAHRILRDLRRHSKAKRCVFINGNHEARLDKYVQGQASALHGVRGLSIPGMLRLEDIGWENVEFNGRFMAGPIMCIHGIRYGVGTAMNNLRHYGVSVVQGHSHKVSSAHMSFVGGRQIESHEIGCLASTDVEYTDHPNWQHAVAVSEYDTRNPRQHWVTPYVIRDGEVRY